MVARPPGGRVLRDNRAGAPGEEPKPQALPTLVTVWTRRGLLKGRGVAVPRTAPRGASTQGDPGGGFCAPPSGCTQTLPQGPWCPDDGCSFLCLSVFPEIFTNTQRLYHRGAEWEFCSEKWCPPLAAAGFGDHLARLCACVLGCDTGMSAHP